MVSKKVIIIKIAVTVKEINYEKLIKCLQCDDVDTFRKLCREHGYIHGEMVWKRAVLAQSLKIINYLFEMEPNNLNYHNEDGITMLYTATVRGKFESFKLLIDLGADPNIEFDNGMWEYENGNNIFSLTETYKDKSMYKYLEGKCNMIKSANKV